MFFLVSIFPNLAILVGEKWKQLCKFKKKCKQQKIRQNFEITNLKEKKFTLNE
jgi:hypothetical protein